MPVLYVDLDPDEEALVLATLDPISAMAGRDDDKLRALLAEITVDDAGLLALLDDLAGNDPKAGLTDPDEVPDPPEEPYVKPGELYVLGDHRLLCGDTTTPEDVARLLDGAAPTLLATDPPYGVQLDTRCPRLASDGLGSRSPREVPPAARRAGTRMRSRSPRRRPILDDLPRLDEFSSVVKRTVTSNA